MIYIAKILGFSIYHLRFSIYHLRFSIYHLNSGGETLCGLNLKERQYKLRSKLPEDKGFVCHKCKRIKNRYNLTFELDQKKEINSINQALTYYGNAHVLFSMTNEMERTFFGLEEALEFSSTYILDSLENLDTTYEPSVNENKIQLSYPLRNEIWNPEIEFSKLEYFSSVIKKRVFESLKERKN